MAIRARSRGHLPPRDSIARLLLIRGVALAALGITAAYLGWRALATLNLDAWFLAIPMLAFEIHAVVGLGLFTFSLWDVDRRPPRRGLGRMPSIAVVIPTYNEGAEILVPTIAAAVALEPVHETWVLDDGNRPEVAELAVALGARYLARPTHEYAKAGNLNHALGTIDVEILAVLDADHVAAPDFLLATLGYFADPKVAVVQTPQDFYNVTSFEHGAGIAYGEPFHEQTLFYRLLQPGKNRWNAAFWCGTNALIRVAALRDVGGAATDTITEDIHTTIRLHRRGWKSVYHNEVLARGLAADDAAQYQLQRNRWGTGAMQVLRVENPLWVSGLSLGQRLAYASTLVGWFDSWRTLALLLLPPAVLLSGQIPIIADGATFALLFTLTYVSQQAALFLLGRGAYRPLLSVIFDLVRMAPNFRPRSRSSGDARRASGSPQRGAWRPTAVASTRPSCSACRSASRSSRPSSIRCISLGCSIAGTSRSGRPSVPSPGSSSMPGSHGSPFDGCGRSGSPPNGAAPFDSPSMRRARSMVGPYRSRTSRSEEH